MDDIPLNSVALPDGKYQFKVGETTYTISRIEYDDHKVISTITPPHPVAAAVLEQHILKNRGVFGWDEFTGELRAALKK